MRGVNETSDIKEKVAEKESENVMLKQKMK